MDFSHNPICYTIFCSKFLTSQGCHIQLYGMCTAQGHPSKEANGDCLPGLHLEKAHFLNCTNMCYGLPEL